MEVAMAEAPVRHEADLSAIHENAEESIAQSIVPYNRDDDRARYLGLRSSGFSIREALQLIGKAKSTLSLWRTDPNFVSIENRLPEFRQKLAVEYVNLEFIRNYRLILEKDFRVIYSSLNPRKDKDDNSLPMAAQDFQYLLKMRSHYTPQQLQIIETVVNPDTKDSGTDDALNFTEMAIRISRTKETLEVGTRQRSPAELSKIELVQVDKTQKKNSNQ